MVNIEKEILKQSENFDSFYIYDREKVRKNIRDLKDNFPGVKFLYSIKTNPLSPVLKEVAEAGMGFDAASRREVLLAAEHGAAPDMIYYSAPGKTEKDITAALSKAVITADSINEIHLIEKCACKMGVKAQIAVRINPGFTMDSKKGAASKFGIDEDIFFANVQDLRNLPHTEIIGIHVHSRSQELNAGVLKNYYENMLALTDRVNDGLGTKLKFVNMGGGLGIPYSPDDKPLDTKDLGRNLNRLIEDFISQAGDIQVYIETGRFIIGNAGTYAAKVVDKKTSYGKTFVILNNTLNGFLRPAIACILEGITENPPMVEPLYTKPDAFPIYVLQRQPSCEKEIVTLAGNLCTRTDTVARDIELPLLDIKDMVCFGNAGSYRAVLTPFQFRSLEKPRQIYIHSDGRAEITEI